MKRLALLLAATVLGTGCIVVDDDPVPSGRLDVTWSFVRTKYDLSTVNYGCARAGVDSVTLSFSRGGSRTFACAPGGASQVSVEAGSQSVTVTGYRGAVPLYSSQFTVNVPQNGTAPLAAAVYGIPGDMTIWAHFREWNGADVGWSTCALAGVTTLTWSLVDYGGTVIDTSSMACTNPAGVTYAGASALDRDTYTIRMQGFPPTGPETFDSATTQVAPTCSGQPFNHYGSAGDWDVILYAVDLNPTFCP